MSELHGYEISDEIGSGAYGTMCRVWQAAVGREVTIAELKKMPTSQKVGIFAPA